MGIVIGMDEAGYGPNLGPLVVTVTVWDVPGHPRETDLWTSLADVISPLPTNDPSRLHVADSKQVYSPARGLGKLERGVLTASTLAGCSPTSFRELWDWLDPHSRQTGETEPWFTDEDLPLPHKVSAAEIAGLAERLRVCCERSGIHLRTIQSDVVLTSRFNRQTHQADSKGLALSRISLRLLRRVWDADSKQPVQITADKHGGRNRYDTLLAEVLDGQMIFRGRESRDESCYRVGSTELSFRKQAESHLAVALASMVCKYVRELAMTLFNRFWCAQVPGLKPTKGYPVDARRFKQEIADAQLRLGISEDELWRAR